MTTDYIPREVFTRIFEALTPQNALVLELCMGSGMRISDALSMTFVEAIDLRASGRSYYDYTEKKTGKARSAYISEDWLSRAILQSNPRSRWLFAGRDPEKHRTRQAVQNQRTAFAGPYCPSHGPEDIRRGFIPEGRQRGLAGPARGR